MPPSSEGSDISNTNHVLLDLDGTLTDPEEGITACIRYALERLDVAVAADVELASFIGPPLLQTFQQLCGSHAQATEGVRLYRERFATVGLYENRVYDGIEASLEKLCSQGFRLYVATSKPGVYASRIIEHFELNKFFANVYGSELDGVRSDKTDLLAYILQQESISAQDAVMVGDRRYDMRGARNHGIACVGALWGFGSEAELREAGADALCEHPAALSETVASMWNIPDRKPL